MPKSRIPECGHPEREHEARGMCASCYTKDSRRRDPEKYNARARRYREQNPGKADDASRLYRERHPERVADIQRRYRAANPDKIRQIQRDYKEQNPEKIRAWKRKYYSQSPERNRERSLQRNFGIGLQQFNAMLKAQEGLCAICTEAPATDVDHNHLTGQVRAVLCAPCNRGLGHFREQERIFKNALAYLAQYGADPQPYQSVRESEAGNSEESPAVQLSLLVGLAR